MISVQRLRLTVTLSQLAGRRVPGQSPAPRRFRKGLRGSATDCRVLGCAESQARGRQSL